VSRRLEPEASLPRELSTLLLDSLPANAVLFVAGDNDTYPLWYTQQVERRRRDITVVTMPLLGAPWYQAELERRSGLIAGSRSRDMAALSHSVANSAREHHRPVAASLMVPEADRDQLSRSWRLAGVMLLDESLTLGAGATPMDTIPVVAIDSQSTRATAATVERWLQGRAAHPAVDPVNEYFLKMLACPRLVLDRQPTREQSAPLDTLCNLRLP
jgi:hypothetical protein